MDTSTAPLARVRSNRAMISAVRHRSQYMREPNAPFDLLPHPLQEGEEEEDEIEDEEAAVEHMVINTTATTGAGGVAATAAAAAAKDVSEARHEGASGGPGAKPTKGRPTLTRLINPRKRERTASLSSSSSSSSLISSSPDETAAHSPPAATSGGHLKTRPTKIREFDNTDNTTTQTGAAWSPPPPPLPPPPPPSTIPHQPRVLKRRTMRRRTETSYDEDTTHYLKRVFFEVYGHGRKLSKVERRTIEADTGLMSRKITYWFSNQKRRFSAELRAFQRLSSEGILKTYDEFLIWCEKNDIPGMDPVLQQDEDDERQGGRMCVDRGSGGSSSSVAIKGQEIVALARPS